MAYNANAMAVRGLQGREGLPTTLTIATGRNHTAETILRAWYEGKSLHTIRAYQRDLEAFSQYFSGAVGICPPLRTNAVLDTFFRQSAPSAHEIVLGFRHFLESSRLAPASINRHLATLRSVSKLARMLGLSMWTLEVGGVKSERRRDTRGPTPDVIARLLDATTGDTEQQTRDYAIVMTFYCCGLRVSELCGLALQDTNFETGTTWILGKGRREREIVPLPPLVVAAIQRYVVFRGSKPGPLFQTLGNRGTARDGGLETRSVLRIIRDLGHQIGQRVCCHGLRHSSITQAAEVGQRAGFGLEKIRAHSRHKHIGTLMTYIDDHGRAENQRTLAELVEGTLPAKTPEPHQGGHDEE